LQPTISHNTIQQNMRKVFIILIFATITLSSFGQKEPIPSQNFSNKNSIQFELFGHGLLYSFNYERIILNGQKFKTTVQAGIAYYPPKADIRDIWIPVLINELYSFDKHHIEIGFGYVFINEAIRDIDDDVISRDWNALMTGRIGYRYQKPDGRFIFRVGFTPIYEYEYNEFHPSGGLTVGYSF
jgi:hypothetical protein